MIRVRNIRLEPGESEERLQQRAARKLRLAEDRIQGLTLLKKSLDARKKNDLHYRCAVAVTVSGRDRKSVV